MTMTYIVTSLFAIIIVSLLTIGNLEKHKFPVAFLIAVIETIVISGVIHLAKLVAFGS
jgi:hypothetical protein